MKKYCVIILLIAMLAVCLSMQFEQCYFQNKIEDILSEKKDIHPQLKKWKEKNKDIYAWLSIADTNIEYPIVMEHEKGYYLNRDYEKEKSSYGSIYSEAVSSPLLTDVQTIFYGHNMRDGSMFGSLAKFLEPEYFNEHREIKVYLEWETRTYEIIAAYVYTDRHPLEGMGTKELTTKDYIDTVISHADKAGGNVWEETIPDGNILTLSTCHDLDNSKRVLVQGVLKNIEKYK